MDEFDLVDRLIAPLVAAEPGAFGLANDAATVAMVAGEDLVVTTDMMAEGVHFLVDDPPDLVARKLLRVNLSDLAAMGAKPRGYLLGISLDDSREESWLEAFVAGLAVDQAEFGLGLLGGDTILVRQGVLTLSLTALGVMPQGRALTRSGARAGDILAVSGTIGDGALGLAALSGQLDTADPMDREMLACRYRLPCPRLALGWGLAGVASAALDVSDGLLADAGHIARRSGLRIEIDWPAVPLSPAVRRLLEAEPGLLETVVGGGDDYELLFAVAPQRWREVAVTAESIGTPVAAIGRCVAGSGVVLLDADGHDITPSLRGWRHGVS